MKQLRETVSKEGVGLDKGRCVNTMLHTPESFGVSGRFKKFFAVGKGNHVVVGSMDNEKGNRSDLVDARPGTVPVCGHDK